MCVAPLPSFMDARQEEPGQIIRALRLALEMSQAEFARAAGWSPSTISSWERGRATPSRLAFKTILAFAEERGVRYRPRSPMHALVPIHVDADDAPARAQATTPGPRPALRPLLYAESAHAGATAAGASAASAPESTAGYERAAAPPRWRAEASFRVSLGPREQRSGATSRHVVEVAIVALGFCAALGLREPARRLLGAGAPERPPSAALTAPFAPAAVAAVPPRVETGTVRADAAQSDASAATTVAASSDNVAPPTARLESVLAIGPMARATFRTDNDAVTVVPGEWIGGRLVVAIGADGVTLADRGGARRHVVVGQRTPFD